MKEERSILLPLMNFIRECSRYVVEFDKIA